MTPASRQDAWDALQGEDGQHQQQRPVLPGPDLDWRHFEVSNIRRLRLRQIMCPVVHPLEVTNFFTPMAGGSIFQTSPKIEASD